MTGIPKSPLVGTPLHRCLQDLEAAQTHLGDDVRDQFEAAARLSEADAGIASALATVRAELNRRHLEIKRAEKARSTPPAQIVLRMPGRNAQPVRFDRTKRGIEALFDFIASSMNDGGAGIVALNHELLDLLAAKGFSAQVDELRVAALDMLAAE